MGNLSWESRPGPGVTGSTHTVMVAAFSGWNDAGDAASGTVDQLWDTWGARRIAFIDPDEFVDFTVSRPGVSVVAGVPEELSWPITEIGWCSPRPDLSVVLVRSPEPQFRWRQYCGALVDAADELGCSTVVVLGAMLSEVPHTREVPIFCTANDEAILEAVGLPASDYDGPTGVPGALQEAAHDRGLETLGLWAALPGYAAGVPSPKGIQALVAQLVRMMDLEYDQSALSEATREYSEQLDALVGEDEETAAYLARLEEAYDAEGVALGSAHRLVDEVENFLRDQG